MINSYTTGYGQRICEKTPDPSDTITTRNNRFSIWEQEMINLLSKLLDDKSIPYGKCRDDKNLVRCFYVKIMKTSNGFTICSEFHRTWPEGTLKLLNYSKELFGGDHGVYHVSVL